jgi:Ca2+-binding EF-hand superfamily protein
MIMKQYDKDEDGKLSFKEFSGAIMPKDKNYANLLVSRKPYN